MIRMNDVSSSLLASGLSHLFSTPKMNDGFAEPLQKSETKIWEEHHEFYNDNHQQGRSR